MCLRFITVFTIFDFSLLYSPLLIFPLKIIYFLSLISFISAYRVELTGLIAGISKFILYIALPENVFPFGYLFPFSFLAFAAIEHGRKNNIDQRHLELPLVWLMSSIYLSAAAHKIFHFELMKSFTPMGLWMFLRNDLSSLIAEYCPGMKCGLIEFFIYSSIPMEFTLFLLTVFRKTRFMAFILSAAFHFILGSPWKLIPIAFLCLMFEACIFLVRSGWKVSDLSKFRYNKQFIVILLFFGALATAFSLSENHFSKLAFYTCLSFLVCAPFLYLGLGGFLAAQENETQIPSLQIRWKIVNVAAISLLSLFSFSPWLIDNYQKTYIWGWTVFSGAEMKWPTQKTQIKNTRCQKIPNYFPLVVARHLGEQNYEFQSPSPEFLNRFTREVKRFCE